MQQNIIWKGQLYNSIENCVVRMSDRKIIATSTVIGYFQNTIYKLEYHIETNRNWETLLVEIQSQFQNRNANLVFKSKGNGKWAKNGKRVNDFDNCIDIDISLTPFTNSLPVNRLKLAYNEAKEIDVLYFDILDQQVKAVRQKYKRLSETEYKYQNIPNDFEAVIIVDELGFVSQYPGLFERTAMLKSSYR
jgi:hypothetical protein